MIKEKIHNLINAVKSDPDDIAFVDERLNRFSNYVNTVVTGEYRISIAMAVKEGDELKDAVQTIDRSRRIAHESAIDACNQLNRLSKNLGLEAFFEGDTADRQQVADFCKDFVDELWYSGRYREKGQDLYEALINERKSVTPKSFAEAESVLGGV